MIKVVIDILNLKPWYNVSEEIEIAKGKNKLPENFKDGYKQLKRRLKWKK